MDKYPLTVIWCVRRYRSIVDEALSPHRMLDDDFVELMTQVCHVLLNNDYAAAMSLVGPSFPQCYRMKDTCYEADIMFADMIQVTRTLVEYATYEFKHLGLLADDGTLPYAPKGLLPDLFVLDFIPY